MAWKFINKRVRKCFTGTWYFGPIFSYNLSRPWIAVEYFDLTEECTAAELDLILFLSTSFGPCSGSACCSKAALQPTCSVFSLIVPFGSNHLTPMTLIFFHCTLIGINAAHSVERVT